MRSTIALLALLALAACHRRTSEVMPGADAEARHAAAQQTLDDLAAADAAGEEAGGEAPRPTARVRPAARAADRQDNAAPVLPVAANVAQEEVPAQRR